MNFKLMIFTIIGTIFLSAAPIKPYIFIGESGESVERTKSKIIQAVFFSDESFEIIGEYNPENNPEKLVLILTNPTLQKIITNSNDNAAYLGGMHLAITAKGEMTYVSCQNPEYWAIAFLQDDYNKHESAIIKFKNELLGLMPSMSMRIDMEYGSYSDLTSEEIKNYKYKRKMPGFSDTVKIGEFKNFKEAVGVIESNLASSSVCKQVFTNKTEGKNVQVFGIGLSGNNGESSFFKIFDTGDKRATSFLPYEIIVIENNVFMLNGRYRFALGFPDQSKKIFSKTKSIQKNIEADLRTLMTK